MAGLVVRYSLFWVLLAGATTVTMWLRALIDPFLALFVVSLAMFGALIAIERVLPYRRDWLHNDGQMWHDTAHALLGTAGGARAGTFVAQWAGLLLVGQVLDATSGRGIWPLTWPFWAQLVLVFVVADFGRYIEHRLLHRVPLLWRFHELHHDVDRLSAWKTSRSHLVERFFQPLFMFLPLVAVGAPDEVVFWFITLNTFVGQLDHSNIDFRLGPVEHVLMGPASHRIHHSKDPAHADTNFGSALVVWDRLFGTWRAPWHTGSFDVGVSDPAPRTFIAQLLRPLRR